MEGEYFGPSIQHQRQAMRWDCAKLMACVIVVACLECLLTLAAPTLASLWLGNMADALLNLDVPAIRQGFLPFLGAIVVTVLVVPGMTLIKNLLLTRQGTAYDVFLMNRTLRMPHWDLHRVPSGEFLHCMEVDRTMYYLAVVRLLALPPALMVYGIWLAVLWSEMVGCVCFFLWVLGLAGLPVVYEVWFARRQAKLNQQTSEYEGERLQMELELLSLRDFSKGFELNSFLVQRLRRMFEDYWQHTGQETCCKTALGQMLQFLCTYGSQIGCLLVGAVLVAWGQMDVGGILGGYLLLPTLQRGWETVKQVVVDGKQEKTYGVRMAYFYQDSEQESDDPCQKAVEKLVVEDVSFSYGAQPVLSHLNLTLEAEKNVQLSGPNGCGKSTLASLIAGVCQQDTGRLVDEQGHELSLGRLRRQVAFQEQQGVVFSGTVWENLCLPREKAQAAIQLLTELGFTKPLHDLIEPDGKNISPGERKKILLTRALLQDTPFLVLDEPLNHLDSQAQAALMCRLEARGGGVVIISHHGDFTDRLSLKKVLLGDDRASVWKSMEC